MKLPDTPEEDEIPEIPEIDQLETFIGNQKNQVWIWIDSLYRIKNRNLTYIHPIEHEIKKLSVYSSMISRLFLDIIPTFNLKSNAFSDRPVKDQSFNVPNRAWR